MENSAICYAFKKLDEADFYLGLITVVTTEHKPLPTPTLVTISESEGIKELTDRFPVESQVAYLLSAFANACYSAVEIVRRDKELVDLAKKFCADHPIFYASGPSGGIRTVNTHFKILEASEKLDVPRKSPSPLDDESLDEFFIGARAIPIDKIPYRLRVDYYLSDESPQDSIHLLCSKHHMDLTGFLNKCRTGKMDA